MITLYNRDADAIKDGQIVKYRAKVTSVEGRPKVELVRIFD